MIGNAAEVAGTGVGTEGLEAAVSGVAGQQEGRAENPHGCLQLRFGNSLDRYFPRGNIGCCRRIQGEVSVVRRHPELIDQIPLPTITEGSFPFRRQGFGKIR